jgi:hypothetical protein
MGRRIVRAVGDLARKYPLDMYETRTGEHPSSPADALAMVVAARTILRNSGRQCLIGLPVGVTEACDITSYFGF